MTHPGTTSTTSSSAAAHGAAPSDGITPIDGRDDLIRRHLQWGWVGLCFVLVMGAGLEMLHAFKAPLYLDADSETRRLMWRLAHAHGGLVFLLHLGFATTVSALKTATTVLESTWRSAGKASLLLRVGSIALPAGFFLGGIGAVGGDPSLGIVLVPIGAIALLASAVQTAWACRRRAQA